MIASGTDSTIHLSMITEVLTEVQILKFYLNIEFLPILINSPFRQDSSPSFSIVSPDNNKVYFRDFGNNDKGSVFNLLQRMWNIPFRDVLIKIYKDIPLILNSVDRGIVDKTVLTKSISYGTDVELNIRIREWKKLDFDYWESQGISAPWLKFGNIHPISHIFVKKGYNEYTIPAEKHAYVYIEHKDSRPSIKIYQPYSEFFKWRSQHDYSVWDLWSQLPKQGEKLIISSSRKDSLTIWENTGIPSCSLQSESIFPKAQVIQELKHRFKEVFILYDNDFHKDRNEGRIYGAKLAFEFQLKQIEIPEKFQSKDPAACVLKHGRKTLRTIVLQLTH